MSDERTIKAIEASIRHWEENVKKAEEGILDEEDISADACALCHEFNSAYNEDADWLDECDACPLYIDGNGCENERSPWRNVSKALEHTDYENLEDVINASRRMLDVLKELKRKYEVEYKKK